MNSSSSFFGLLILVGSVLTYVCLYYLLSSEINPQLPLGSMNIEITATSQTGGATKYQFAKKDGNALTYIEAIKLFATVNKEWLDMVSAAITSHPSKALFWECSSFTANTVTHIPFEFVLIPSSRLERITTDVAPFQAHFAGYRKSGTGQVSAHEAITFYSLGKDALLVVPCPPDLSDLNSNPPEMAHLATFIRSASPAHREALWRKVGTSVLDTLSSSTVSPDTRFWLSTSGLGVSWLHVRIDTVPKYYNWQEYKDVMS